MAPIEAIGDAYQARRLLPHKLKRADAGAGIARSSLRLTCCQTDILRAGH
jgi:hypothetical protein